MILLASVDDGELVEVELVELLVSVGDSKVFKDVLVKSVIHEVGKEVFKVGDASGRHTELDIVVEGQELLPSDHTHQARDQGSQCRP